MSSCSLIVHGGAGDDIWDWKVPAFRAGVIRAAQAGWKILSAGGSAVEAVEAAVNVMEDDPAFDCGRGSFLNAAGEVEMDAIVMDGATLESGAVIAIQRVQHPISVARLVMEKSPHSIFTAAGAEAFARSMGVPVCPESYLVMPQDPGPEGPRPAAPNPLQDTVGAVALDSRGRMAAATSTGGTTGKMPGRVGDSPLIGCGAYVDDSMGGASATGKGEDLIKIIFSKSACDLMATGLTPQQAADGIIRRLADRVDGHGGIILMNPRGEVGYAFNTQRMACAWVNADGSIEAEV